ncbi:MAG: DNA gyrase C-terminal beta-propeller domain-containing protein, partial [Planctomycetota bacterium]|nr:DNA gyrase C-terminal beta-propeller domain-containing protein [Planctomycetota bacterium]
CRQDDEIMFISEKGMVVRVAVADVSSIGRNTQGVRLVNLKDEDRLVAVEIVRGDDLARFDSGDGEDASDSGVGAGEAPEAGAAPDLDTGSDSETPAEGPDDEEE